MDVHHFWAGNVWRKEVLCALTNPALLDIISTLKSKGISITPPGRPHLIAVKAPVSTSSGRSFGFNVHQTLKFPVGLWLAFQINARLPGMPDLADKKVVHDIGLQTVPWVWGKVTLESLPFKKYKTIIAAVRIITTCQIILILLFCSFCFCIALRIGRSLTRTSIMDIAAVTDPSLFGTESSSSHWYSFP
ncbi:hypothetical protein Pmani_019280 [Petrolisthes manimaculis]|uniref:Uncharacterized protein n=1 Tax=Petrolisthes manimaculis TaxID=1843537 RepID=A0AAE1PJ76_9EUCA|nr:hypothetical protein Pmani_019280 [Petrolisthes manimaculis]